MNRTILTLLALALVMLVSTAEAAGPITGKLRGAFNRYGVHGIMYGGQNLRRYVKTPDRYVWCAWQDGKVLVHVRMKNTSAEQRLHRGYGASGCVPQSVSSSLSGLVTAGERPDPSEFTV
jgi:hypothetical protein